jgi:hypothetical protein
MKCIAGILFFAVSLFAESKHAFLESQGNTVWSADTIIIGSTLTLNLDDTLTIKAGVIIKSELETTDDPVLLYGVLNVEGTAEKPVIFEFSPFLSGGRPDTTENLFLLKKSAKANLSNCIVRKQEGLDPVFDLEDSARMELRKCSFIDNKAQLFRLNGKSAISIKGTSFINNSSTKGMIFFDNVDSVSLTADSCNFTGNRSRAFGADGTFTRKCFIKLSDCNFTKDTTGGSGGVISINADGKIEISDCVFSEIRATGVGGVLYVSGAKSTVKISDSRFENNSSLDASGSQGNCGAFIITAASVSISNTSFIKNSSGSGTGCGYINAKAISIIQTVFYGNYATRQTDLFAGALMLYYPSSLLIANCTFVNNRSSTAGGLYLAEVQTGNNRVVNTIFAGNTGQYGSQIFIEKNNNTVFSNCFVSSGSSNIYLYNAIEKSQNFKNIINTGALFADSAAGNLTLAANSPCVNAGLADTTGLSLPQKDLSGKVNRIVGKAVDIGAYEFPTDISIRYVPDHHAAFRSSDPAMTTICTIDGKIVRRDAAHAASGGIISQPAGAGVYLAAEKTQNGCRIIRKLVRY